MEVQFSFFMQFLQIKVSDKAEEERTCIVVFRQEMSQEDLLRYDTRRYKNWL